MSSHVHASRIPSSLPISMGRTFALRRGRAQWLTVVLTAIALLTLPRVLSVFWIHLANGCLIAVPGAVAPRRFATKRRTLAYFAVKP